MDMHCSRLQPVCPACRYACYYHWDWAAPPLLAIATCPVAARHRATRGWHRGRHYRLRLSKHLLLPPTSVGFAAYCLTGQACSHHLFTAPVGEFGFLHPCATLRALPVVHRPRAGHTHFSLLSDLETYLTERCRPELAVRIVKWRSPVSFSTTMTVIMWLLDEDALPELRQRTNAEM
jgi:hypothetical protein